MVSVKFSTLPLGALFYDPLGGFWYFKDGEDTARDRLSVPALCVCMNPDEMVQVKA